MKLTMAIDLWVDFIIVDFIDTFIISSFKCTAVANLGFKDSFSKLETTDLAIARIEVE